jgi:hypothetical protein
MGDKITYEVQGSAPDPYIVILTLKPYRISCTCQAGYSGLPCKHRLAILSGENPGIVKGDISLLPKIAELTKCTNLSELLEAWESARNQKKNAVKRADYAFKNYREAREKYGLKNVKPADMDEKYLEAVANAVDQCVECEKLVQETLKILHTIFIKPK